MIDVWSRRIVGWSFGETMTSDLVLAALNMALELRKPEGVIHDNAMAESVFASLECELIERRSFKTKTEARLAVFTWIEAWYNPRRRHSAHGRISPVNFERMHADKLKPPPPGAQHGLPTAGLCVARATLAVDNPATALTIT